MRTLQLLVSLILVCIVLAVEAKNKTTTATPSNTMTKVTTASKSTTAASPSNSTTSAPPPPPPSVTTDDDEIESDNGEILEPESLDLQDDSNNTASDDDDDTASDVDLVEDYDQDTKQGYYFDVKKDKQLQISKLDPNIDLTQACELYVDCFNCSLSEKRCNWLNGDCVAPDSDQDDQIQLGQTIRAFVNKADTCDDPLNICDGPNNEPDATYFGWNITEPTKNLIIPSNYFCTTQTIMAENDDGIDTKQKYKVQANFTENNYIVLHEDQTDDNQEAENDEEFEATNKLNIQWDNGSEQKEIVSAPAYYVALVYINISPIELNKNEDFSISVRVLPFSESFWSVIGAWWFLILAFCGLGGFCFYSWWKTKGSSNNIWVNNPSNNKHFNLPTNEHALPARNTDIFQQVGVEHGFEGTQMKNIPQESLDDSAERDNIANPSKAEDQDKADFDQI